MSFDINNIAILIFIFAVLIIVALPLELAKVEQ